jgi:hypothetical protein
LHLEGSSTPLLSFKVTEFNPWSLEWTNSSINSKFHVPDFSFNPGFFQSVNFVLSLGLEYHVVTIIWIKRVLKIPVVNSCRKFHWTARTKQTRSKKTKRLFQKLLFKILFYLITRTNYILKIYTKRKKQELLQIYRYEDNILKRPKGRKQKMRMPVESSIYWDSVGSQRSTSVGSSGDAYSSAKASRHYVDPWDMENYVYLCRHSAAGLAQQRQRYQQQTTCRISEEATSARSENWWVVVIKFHG